MATKKTRNKSSAMSGMKMVGGAAAGAALGALSGPLGAAAGAVAGGIAGAKSDDMMESKPMKRLASIVKKSVKRVSPHKKTVKTKSTKARSKK